MYKVKTKTIPYVMTWGGIVTSYHIQELNIQSVVQKKILESVSLERRRGTNQDEVGDEEMKSALEKLVGSSVEHREETKGGGTLESGSTQGKNSYIKARHRERNKALHRYIN